MSGPREYTRGGDAVNAVKKVIEAAVPRLKNPTACFDIDHTVFVDTGEPRRAGCALYNWLCDTYPSVRIAFVTARPESPAARRQAIADLKSVGCWRKRHVLMLMPPETRTDCQVSIWKNRSRDALRGSEQLLCSIGDTWWDSVHEYSAQGKNVMGTQRDPTKFWVGSANADQAVVSLKLPRA